MQQATQANPRDARVPYQLGLVYRKQGRDEEAKKALALSDDLRQRDSRESQLRLECRQKLDQGLREEAHAVCEQLYDPDNADKLTELGTIYGQHGDLEAALKPLRRAAELAPQSPQMQYNLALAYYQLNRFEDARGPLADSLKRWPDLFQLNALYGAVLMKRESTPPRIRYWATPTSSIRKTPGLRTCSTSRRSNWGAAARARQYPDALRYFEETSKLRPQEAAPHRQLAEIYTLTGRSAQAAAEQQEADQLANNLGGLQ